MRSSLFSWNVGLLVFSLCLPRAAWSDIVISTAVGLGADVEMREQTDDSANSEAMNTRTALNGDRNEIIGLRFDLAGHTPAHFTNVSLQVVSYRTDANTRVVNLHGVAAGTVSGSGLFTTEDWDETALTTFGDLPGLLVSDGNFLTQSLNPSNVTLLGQITVSGTTEGAIFSFNDPTLTTFLNNHSGSSLVTLLLTAGNTSSGQFRIASKEATNTVTSLLTGAPGDFAPRLSFSVVAVPPPPVLLITNLWRTADQLVLAGLGGTSNGHFVLLAGTEATLPATEWSVVTTNAFDAEGRFIVTNVLTTEAPSRFFQLQTVTVPSPPDPDLVGFATLSGGTTGGAGGSTVTVSTPAEFVQAVNFIGPTVIQVSGVLEIGTLSVFGRSDKTILGLGDNSGLLGNLRIRGCTNFVLRNLHLLNPNPAEDALSLQEFSERIWVNHCSFGEAGDGQIDITRGASFVTVSWCKFAYTNFANNHRYSSLVGHDDGNAAEDTGRFLITYHHNWWGTLCEQRMPRVRFGRVHVFNNYYSTSGNIQCIVAALESQLRIEHNVFEFVHNPWRTDGNGLIHTTGNLLVFSTGLAVETADPVFTPPYPYTLLDAADVPGVVIPNAGAGAGPFAP